MSDWGIPTASRKLKWGAAYYSMLCGCFPIVCNGCSQLPGSLYPELPRLTYIPSPFMGCAQEPERDGNAGCDGRSC
jgi:hypothetical protein